NSWEDRGAEYDLFTKDPEIRRILESQGVKRIGYRALRDLQRKSRSETGGAKSTNLDAQSSDQTVSSLTSEATLYQGWYFARREDSAAAKPVAREYLTQFPNGKYAAFLVGWLAMTQNVLGPMKPVSNGSTPVSPPETYNVQRVRIDDP